MITFFSILMEVILTELDKNGFTLQGGMAPLGPSTLKFCVHP